MDFPTKDLLLLTSIPFRIMNRSEISETEFIFSLSYGHITNCTFSDAKKVLFLALKKEFVKRVNNKLVYHNVNLWVPKLDLLNWSPNFNLLKDVEEEPLTSLPKTEPLKNKIAKRQIDELQAREVKHPPVSSKVQSSKKKVSKPEQLKEPTEKELKPKIKLSKKKKPKDKVIKRKKKKKKVKTLESFFS